MGPTVDFTKVKIAPMSIFWLFVGAVVFALVIMSAKASANYIAARARRAKDMAVEAASPASMNADAFEVEA